MILLRSLLPFDDILDNPWDDVSDGKAHVILLTLKKSTLL